MTSSYQPLGQARYAVEQIASGEQLRIKAARSIFPMLFLPVWLTGWTIGGITAISQLVVNFQPFLVIWLIGWAVGWVAVASTLAWMFTGSETLRFVGSDLEIAHHAAGFTRRWLYQGSQIRNLSVAPQPAWPFRFQWQVPFVIPDRTGSVKFNYGARTYYAAPGLDDTEGQMIVEHLQKRLPTAR